MNWKFWKPKAEAKVVDDFYEDGDYIVSKKYGRYRKEVPFVQGMTIYPHQKAIVTFVPNNLNGAPNGRD